ncbi:MAG: hypothetical protein WA784_12345, partial [Albidovulum sp.]
MYKLELTGNIVHAVGQVKRLLHHFSSVTVPPMSQTAKSMGSAGRNYRSNDCQETQAMADEGDIVLSELDDDELVLQMHDDLY